MCSYIRYIRSLFLEKAGHVEVWSNLKQSEKSQRWITCFCVSIMVDVKKTDEDILECGWWLSKCTLTLKLCNSSSKSSILLMKIMYIIQTWFSSPFIIIKSLKYWKVKHPFSIYLVFHLIRSLDSLPELFISVLVLSF